MDSSNTERPVVLLYQLYLFRVRCEDENRCLFLDSVKIIIIIVSNNFNILLIFEVYKQEWSKNFLSTKSRTLKHRPINE